MLQIPSTSDGSVTNIVSPIAQFSVDPLTVRILWGTGGIMLRCRFLAINLLRLNFV